MSRLLFLLPLIVVATLSSLPTFIHAASPTTPAPQAVAPATVATPLPNVQLKFTINRNGLPVSRPQVQVELNHAATVLQQEAKNPYRYKIEVTPTLEVSTSMIHLDFKIYEVTDQETTLLSTPAVTVFNGDSADVVQKKAHSDELKITVTPSLIN